MLLSAIKARFMCMLLAEAYTQLLLSACCHKCSSLQMSLLNQMEKFLDEVEWVVTKIKADLSTASLGNHEGNLNNKF